MTTIQAVLNSVVGESGFTVPASYTSSSNPDDTQLIYLLNAAADDIRESGYQELVKQGSITMTTAETYDLPDDFHGYVSDTLRVQGNIEPGELPTSAAAWASLKSGNILSGITANCRFIGGKLAISTPTPGDVLTFEYISSRPFTDSGGTPKEQATADSDIWLLDRRLLAMATKWRWKKEKGLGDWDVDFKLFQKYANGLRARNSGAKTITFGEPPEWTGEPYTPRWVV